MMNLKSRSLVFFVVALLSCMGGNATHLGMNNLNVFSDISGNQFVPRGFVFNTEDLKGEIFYTKQDYFRAARLGANFQVIRLDMARLGGWPGYELDSTYIQKLSRLVRLGDTYGMKTAFKMTVYQIRGFKWENLWLNKTNEQKKLIQAWKNIWMHFKDNPAVFAYDILNEPRRGNIDLHYDDVQKQYLIPLYEQLIDSLHTVDTTKWAMYQPILMESNPDRAKRAIPFWAMKVPLYRSKIIYAPHIYQLDLAKIKPTFEQYFQDAALSNAPVFIGEWGSATYEETDVSIHEQHRYQKAYMRVAELGDSLGIGMIKAWFLGSRWKGRNHMGMFTWSMFKDSVAVGTVERKYIVDVIARPYPQSVAGQINSFEYTFATREFRLNFVSRRHNQQSAIFLGANRHYPDGFSVFINDQLVAIFDPIVSHDTLVITSKLGTKSYTLEWNDTLQQLLVTNHTLSPASVDIKVCPGTQYYLQ